MKSDAQIASSSRPSAGATVAPIAETPVAEVPVAEVPVVVVPVAETPVMEAPVDETQGAEALVAPPPHLLPRRQVEWAMANRGQSRWRPAKRRPFREVGLQSMPGPN